MNTPSIFYTARYGRSFAIPMLAYEFMGLEFAKDGVAEDEKMVVQVYREALEGICKVKYTTENLKELVDRSQRIAKEASETATASDRPAPKPKKGFTTGFYKYFLDLPADKLLLQVCGNDYAAAENLYCSMDREDAMELVSGYIARLQQDQGVMLEACAFGFGGEASGGSSGEVVDLDPGDIASAKETFKGLF